MTPLTLVHVESLARRYFDSDVLARLVGLPEGAVLRLRRGYVRDVVEAWRRESSSPGRRSLPSCAVALTARRVSRGAGRSGTRCAGR